LSCATAAKDRIGRVFLVGAGRKSGLGEKKKTAQKVVSFQVPSERGRKNILGRKNAFVSMIVRRARLGKKKIGRGGVWLRERTKRIPEGGKSRKRR